ncbi:MAG: oxidoreductase, partial [Magnetococcus sp. WYHC-3]
MAPLPKPNGPTVEAILAAYEADAGSGFRPHLGASLIGKECDRSLWLDFRWAARARFGGRMLRL